MTPLIVLRRIGLVACLGAACALSACTKSTLRLAPDFGSASRQDAVAQIADPDARYAGKPDPGSDGARVDLAQKRYQQNQVIQSVTPTASGAATPGANMGNGAGVGAGVSAAGPLLQ